VPEEVVGDPVVLVFCCYAGSLEDGEETVRPLKESGPAPLADMISPLPFTTLVGLGADAAPPGLRNRWRSHFLEGLYGKAIEAIIKHGTGPTSPRYHVMAVSPRG